jgi:outer membrane beta-barrel protein
LAAAPLVKTPGGALAFALTVTAALGLAAGDARADEAAAAPHAELPEAEPEPEPAGAPAEPPRFGKTGICIDAAIADRLAVKRQRRAAVDRLYVKHARHELSAGGGYYVSDLYSGTYVASAAYTYHMTETTAVEFSAAMTYAKADLIRALEEGRADILDDERAPVLIAESLLIWTPMYGKFRLGGQIMRFDLHLDAGFGVIDAPTSRGLSAVAGAGMKLFLSEALALRLDARDHIHHQQLLDSSFLVNDLSLTLGLSLFLPMRN